MRKFLWLALLLAACSSTTEPTPAPRTYVVTGMWVVFLTDEQVCFQLDAYHAPEMDSPNEAIAACKQHFAVQPYPHKELPYENRD